MYIMTYNISPLGETAWFTTSKSQGNSPDIASHNQFYLVFPSIFLSRMPAKIMLNSTQDYHTYSSTANRAKREVTC